MPDPTVLTYARYFGLTQDYTLRDPITYINTPNHSLEKTAHIDSNDNGCKALVDKFREAAQEHVSLKHDDQLVVSQSVTQYLRKCTDRSIGNIEQIRQDLLPDPYRFRKLKLDLPLLKIGGGDAARDAKKIRRRRNLDTLIEELICDDVEEDHDDKNDVQERSEQNVPSAWSSISAEMLQWARNQTEAAMKREKLEVSTSTLKYVQASLSQTLDTVELSKILQNEWPARKRPDADSDVHLNEADFDIDNDTEDSLLVAASRSEIDEIPIENLQFLPKEEPNILCQLDAAINEEQFLLGTQADRDYDELFRQFTNHDSTDFPVTSSSDHIEAVPASKRRKLNHNTEDNSALTELRHPTLSPTQLKLTVPDIADDSSKVNLPEIDLSVVIKSDSRSEELLAIDVDPGPPPFKIPQINETLHEFASVCPKVLERYVAKNKAIVSSDKLVWKEPGIRVLDLESEEINLLVSDYDIEDQTDAGNVGKREQYQHTELSSAIDEQKPRANSSHKRVDPQKSCPGKTPAILECPTTNHSCIKEELCVRKTDLTYPFARSAQGEAPAKNNLKDRGTKRRLQSSVQHIETPSLPIQTQQEPSISETFVRTGDRKLSKQRSEGMTLKSLVPQWMRDKFAPGDHTRSKSSPENPLSNFLHLQGKFKLAQESSRTAELADDPILSTQNSIVDSWDSDGTFVQSPQLDAASYQQDVLLPLTPLAESMTIVVNNALLKTKPLLIQFLERHDIARLTLIYRDLDSAQFSGPDLVLNASTCLIITNVQALTQRPLPGQKSATGLSSVHDRLLSIVSFYSQIIVLVHYNLVPGPEAQIKTTSAQASFAAFTASLGHQLNNRQVQPYWLPCINPAFTSDIVNAWVWQMIGQHGHRDKTRGSVLIQDETLWEVFLHQAGLNPLAAQILIGSLRKPTAAVTRDPSKEPSWGLRRLVAMDSQERMRMFGGMVGPDVVDNLNKVLSKEELLLEDR